MVPYDDPHYRRKNLSILSLIFIIYILAGGSISNEDGHTLPFLNISLDRPWVVVAIASLILVWFAIRYWQTEPADSCNRHDYLLALQGATQKWCKTYSGGRIPGCAAFAGEPVTAELVPDFSEINTIRPWKLLQNIRNANPKLINPGTNQYSDWPAKAEDANARSYSKPSLIKAAVLGWRIRRETLTALGIYDDWLLPWALFILATLLTITELTFAALHGMLS